MQVEVYRIEELHALAVGVIEHLADGVEPDGQLAILLDLVALVAPVGSQSLLCDLVHPLATYLHLDPLGVGAEDGQV